MTIIQSIILGIVQGLTEFLPISSSGHLVLIPHLLGWEIPPQDAFIFDVLVQVATLIAVFAYFWTDIISIMRVSFKDLVNRQPVAHPESRLAWLLFLATLPASIVGFIFSDAFKEAFDSPEIVSIFLMITAVLLVAAEKIGKRQRDLENLTWPDAIWIGIFQVLALFPGISRSGATITGAMMRDIDRPSAARFSFLMSIPIMVAAGSFAIAELFQISHFAELLPTFAVGFIVAAVVGYLSIRWLIKFLSHRSLIIFAIYCAAFGFLNLLIVLLQSKAL